MIKIDWIWWPRPWEQEIKHESKAQEGYEPSMCWKQFLSIIEEEEEEEEQYGQGEEWIRFLEPNGPSIWWRDFSTQAAADHLHHSNWLSYHHAFDYLFG